MAEEKIVFNPDVEKQGMKPKKERKPKTEEKPKTDEKHERQHFINQYGFLGISNNLRKHLGLPKFGKESGRKVFVTIEPIECGFIVKVC